MVLSVTDFKAAFDKHNPKKPKKDLFFSGSKRSDKAEIQKAIAASSPDKARAIFEELAKSDSKFAGELAAYKMDKHKDDPKMRGKYLLAIPHTLWNDDLRREFIEGDFDWIPDAACAKDVLKVMEHLPAKTQVEMLTRNGGKFYKKLEGTIGRDEMFAVNKTHRDGLETAFGITERDKTAVTSSVFTDPFDPIAAEKAVAALGKKNPAYAVSAMAEALKDAKGDRATWTKLFMASKEHWGKFSFAIPELGASGDFSWLATKDQAKEMRKTLLDQTGSGRVAWLQNASFLTAMEKADPKGFQELVDAVPQLKTVYGVRDSLKGSKHTAGSKEYLQDAAEGIFGSILGEGTHPLEGFSYEADASRDGRLNMEDWLSGAVEGETAGPCSVLTNVFTKLALTWPGPGKLRIGVGEIVPPVMTRPLKDIDPNNRGMVTRGFAGKAGNVYENGSLTGRVFFSGGGTGAAHTWITINDVAFDTLFGTMGDDVPAAAEERFEQDPKKPDRYVGKTSGRVLIRDPKLKNPGEAMGFASYRLEKKK
jgi:hypothetical protein